MSREYPCVYYDDQKCTLHSEPGYTDWCVMGSCSHETPSNADHIRSMTDDELAAYILCPRDLDPRKTVCTDLTCIECAKDWLKQPYKEDT